MDVKSLLDIQKRGIAIHRIVYILFFLQRLLQQLIEDDILIGNTAIVLVFLGICMIIEETFYRTKHIKSIMLIRVIRYIQCVFSMFLVCYLQVQENFKTMMIGLVLLLMADYFLTMEDIENYKVTNYIIGIGIPVVLGLVTKMSVSTEFQWMFWLFDILITLTVVFSAIYFFVDYMNQKEEEVLIKKRELRNIVEQNENILFMQDKLKNTNNQLNVQKLELQNAYKKIQMANQEMIAQAEILRYISMSLDVSKISNQITDAIMQVRELSFCAVYIKEDVYLNKHANYVIKTSKGQLQSKIKDNIAELYNSLITKGQMEVVCHDNLEKAFPFLVDANIQSVYIRLLKIEDESYGLFMIGDSRSELFNDNMSFYDAIIAQYDIAISNAKIYNDMKYMARKDGLTKINNRIYFNQLFADSLEQIMKEDGCVSVALIDIDRFKSVNDTYGHFAGDEVIKCVASMIERCINKYNGFVCRYGGEEFVAALPNTKLEIAQPIIEELFDEICSTVVEYNEYSIPLSVSIGLTSYPEICKSTDELLKRADWCMYYAKEHGRHQINVDNGTIERA